jgi:hypothetical protein
VTSKDMGMKLEMLINQLPQADTASVKKFGVSAMYPKFE